MSIRNLDRMFQPASLALIGASPNPKSVGGVVLRNLVCAGFAGPLMLVNPRHQTIDAMPVYPDVESLPSVPDLAVIATPPETVPQLIGALGRRGTRAAVVITAGFAELGERGRALQQEMLDAARPFLLRIVGPNGVGIIVPGSNIDASFAHLAPKAGDLAFISQSGAMITAVLDWAASREIGFSHVVSLGDTADVDFGDMLEYLGTDSGTRAILLYIEAVTSARKFMSAARAAARLKSVLVVKAGRFAESARAAASHTGALAGSDAVYDAAFRRAGLLRVQTMTELFDAVETLAVMGPQRGEQLMILTNGGGPGVLATDAIVSLGGRLGELSEGTRETLNRILPRTWSHNNPVDIIGDADRDRYAAAFSALIDEPNADAVLVLHCPTALVDSASCAEAIIETTGEAREAGKLGHRNVLTSWLGEATAAEIRRRFAAARVPTYSTPEQAVAGFMHAVRFRRNLELLLETPSAQPDDFVPDAKRAAAIIASAIQRGPGWLDAEDLVGLFGAYCIPLAETRFVADPAAAADAAAALAGPVALKIRSPDVTHKTEIGGVALNLQTPKRVAAEADAMLRRVAAERPDARLKGFLVQRMIQRPGAVELIVGMNEDAIFGPVILFGHGGIAVEQLRDITLELAPLNASLALAQMSRTRVWQLLQGYRNQRPADIRGIASVLTRVSQLAADHPEILELDINPLLADSEGVIAVDARIRVAPARQSGIERLSILPYPRELTTFIRLPSGTSVRIEPIKPEDEKAVNDMVARMDPEDRRMRFFVSKKELSHAMVARLTQIDYAREMAFVARLEGDPEILGVAQFSADPDNQNAEFAIAVRTDWKGRGIGYALMQQLITVARERGIGLLKGVVLRENSEMLRFCSEFGFVILNHPNEPTMVSASLKLHR